MRRSLSVRFVAMVVLFVIVTGVILGVAVTLVGARNATVERTRSLEYAASVVAASLIPVISDHDTAYIEGQLSGILETGASYDIECIRILDGAGVTIAETTDGCSCDEAVASASGGVLSVFTESQVVAVPVEVDGFKVAEVSVQFRPMGLEEAFLQPIQLIVMVLALAMVVSASWGGWMVMRSVVEPVADLRDAATRISNGERGMDLRGDRGDEIGELALALEHMTLQLERQERELLASYDSLQSAFEDKTELAHELEKTMNMRSDFVAVASHEIRSPLAVIRLYSEMLRDDVFGEMDPATAEAVDSIVAAVARLSVIVSNLMDVALLERGLMSLDYTEVPFHDLIESACGDADAIARGKGTTVQLQAKIGEMNIRGDRVRLRQVLDNLLSNALKYSPDGEVIIVRVEAEEEIRVIVEDHGAGIPKEREEVLFELFGRADASDDAKVSGLGLGLPISQRIAAAHGGGIRFEQRSGGPGAVFTLWLPCEGAPKQTAPGVVDVVSSDDTRGAVRHGQG